MVTSHEHDGYLSHGDCGCGNCDGSDELDYLDEDVFDDPYEVVMYDIDAEPDDLYALIDMLGDSARSWYARRRLNALAASGSLSALVADIIIDSLGRSWNPLHHPRDRFGRFIETGGFIRWLMRGVNLRGQVSRIDSDGNIHVRSVGNDRLPDGAVVRFKPQQASKLISIADPKAGLAEGRGLPDIDLDADIPDFPEASTTQKRIYNTLQHGDMPAEDLDRSIDTGDLSGVDFAAEVLGLQERDLIQIDKTGDKPRVHRSDDGGADVINIEDGEIDDFPDDETPDLDDSPALTKSQRDLLDRLIDADRGENDGVRQDELGDVDEDDFQALIDAGILVPGDDDNYYLENPEPDADAKADIDAPVEPDLTTEIFDAAGERFDDPDMQEAFQHYAEELARPGDENNAPLDEGFAAAKRRNAEAAANKWWEERNAGTPVDEDVLDQREADDFAEQEPDVPKANPKAALNPRNQALADTLAAEWFYDEYLDSPDGVEYRRALKDFFDAEDYDDTGFSDQARLKREDGARALGRLKAAPPDDEIAGLPEAVRKARNADANRVESPDAPEVAEVIVPEDVVPDVMPDAPEVSEEALPDVDPAEALRQAVHGVPEADLPEDVPEADAPEVNPRALWNQFVDKVAEIPDGGEFFAYLEDENRIADELGLDLHGEDAPVSWQGLAEQIGYRPAELLFNDSDGDIDTALAGHLEDYQYLYENELLQKFDRDGDIGIEIVQLRKAGLVEPAGNGNRWQLTDAGYARLGIANEDDDGGSGIAVPDDEDIGIEPFVNRLGREENAPAEDAGNTLDPDAIVDAARAEADAQWDDDRHRQLFVDIVNANIMRTEGNQYWKEEINSAQELARKDGLDQRQIDRIVPAAHSWFVNKRPGLDVPEAATDTQGNWRKYADRVNEEAIPGELSAFLEDEVRIARDLNLNLFDADAPDNWNVLRVEIGDDAASRLFDDSNGDLRLARQLGADNPGKYGGADEISGNELSDPVDVPDAPDAVGDDLRQLAEADVAEAMENAQDGVISRDRAYEVAANAVRDGALNQQDLERIQGDVVQNRADRGEVWDSSLEIDYVGDDQRAVDGDAPDAPELAPDAVDIASSSVQDKIRNQPPFDLAARPAMTENAAGLRDKLGNPIEMGQWYRSYGAGGGGDIGPVVGFLKQDAYPGWFVIQNPDGKLKAVNATGNGPKAGMRRADPLNREADLAEWRAVRPFAAGEGVILDQLNAKNIMHDGVFAEVGMKVSNRRKRNIDPDRKQGGNWEVGEEGVISRIGWDKKKGVPQIFIVRPGDRGQNDEIQTSPSQIELAPATPVPPTPTPDAPGMPTPDLPDGAGDEFEAAVLNAIDGWVDLDGGGGPRKVDIISNLDDDDAGDRLIALRALVERGVLRESVGDDGRPRFGRVVVTPEPGKVDGAENVLEADLLNIIDANDGDAGAVGADLVDIDADDAADRMLALRALVDRRVLRREAGPDGRPVYRRPAAGSGSSPVVMTDAEAVSALSDGHDPFVVINPNMEKALRAAGYKFVPNKHKGVSPNHWAIAPDRNNGPFDVELGGYGPQSGHVYMVKGSNPGISDDILNEVISGELSQGLIASLGRDTPGLLYHPKVNFAEYPSGAGAGRGGSIIMDHAAYGYPEGHIFYNGNDLSDRDLREGGASSSIIGLGLYDFLINNPIDRHVENQMYVQNPNTGEIEVVVIDNGYGFGAPARGGYGPGLTFKAYARASMPGRLFARADRSDRAEVTKTVEEFVSAYQNLDVAATMERIKAMYPSMSPDQAKYVLAWLTEAKARVDGMALDISSVVAIIMAR